MRNKQAFRRRKFILGARQWSRATQDLDLVVMIPFKAVNKLSKELEKRDMLIPAKIILDSILEDRADILINAIHMHSGLKADLYPVREGDELRLSAFQRREQVDYGPPIGRVCIHSPEDLILYKLMYFGLSQQSKHFLAKRSFCFSFDAPNRG